MNCLSGYCIDGIVYPSVSKVLSSNPKNDIAKKSAALNGAALSKPEAQRRGKALHDALRSYLITGETDLSPEFYSYWSQLQQALQVLDLKPLWADGPVAPDLMHLQQGEHSCVWSKKLKVQGCPDFFGTIGGVEVVGELKTGTVPFTKYFEYGNFKNYWNYFKHRSALLQASAYAMCIEETVGFKPKAAIVINVTPSDNQIFVSEHTEFAKGKSEFRKLCRDFFKGDGLAYTCQDKF